MIKNLKDIEGNEFNPKTIAEAVMMDDEATTSIADAFEEVQMEDGTIEFTASKVTKTYASGNVQEITFAGKVITEKYFDNEETLLKTKTTTINADGSISIETEYAE